MIAAIAPDHARAASRLILQICALLLFAPCFAPAANTNVVRVGVFPFADRSAGGKYAVWCRAFSNRLSDELQDSNPPLVEAYYHKVLKALTNNAWDGQQPVSAELAGKVAGELKLKRMVLGEFKRDDQGWEARVQVVEAGAGATPVVLEFKEKSTQELVASIGEKTCAALGVKPNPARMEAWRKFPVSNEAIDRLVVLNRDWTTSPDPKRLAALRDLVRSETNYISARVALLRALVAEQNLEEARAEALKVTELAPGLCVGYLFSADCLEGKEADAQREELLLQALKVHPGCPSAARNLFPTWVSQRRWEELKPVAERAHAARPEEPAAAIGLGAALAGLGEREQAWDVIDEVNLEDEEDAGLHAALAVTVINMRVLAREFLWLQRHTKTNTEARGYLGEFDASFWLAYGEDAPKKSPPRQFSREELQAELSWRLTPEECRRVEDPLKVTEAVIAQASAVTANLTNGTAKATMLLGVVLEEHDANERRGTNTATLSKLPVCHYYASRLVALARAVGLPAWLVHVELSSEEASGYHDRTAIEVKPGRVLQFDPTWGTMGNPSDNMRMLDDVQAIAHHMLQGGNKAGVEIARKLDPEDPWTQARVITELAQDGDPDAAQRLWDALRPECTNRWDYYFSRGVIEKENERYSSALEWFKRADAVSSNNVPILMALGVIHESLNDHRQSVACFERAWKLGAARQWSGRAADLESRIRLLRGAVDGAQASEKEVRAKAESGDLASQLMMANVCFTRREYEAALGWLLPGAKRGDPVFQENYGRNLLLLSGTPAVKGTNTVPEAVKWLREAAKQSNAQACYELSVILYEGRGVPREAAEASLWAHVGAAGRDKRCIALLREMQLFADPGAFADGKKKAEEWLAALGKKL
jgi:TPR repeat protein